MGYIIFALMIFGALLVISGDVDKRYDICTFGIILAIIGVILLYLVN